MEVRLNYVCSRGYLWTEYVKKAELYAKLRDAQSKRELEREDALCSALAELGMPPAHRSAPSTAN